MRQPDEPERNATFARPTRAPIHHTTLNTPGVNASAPVGGSTVNVNFGVLFPQGDEEISQTLIHEMMHCAGFTHPVRRDPPAGSSCAAPNPAVFDCPNDGGVYYGTAPLRAEFCIAGDQSDVRMRLMRKAAQESCVIDEQGLARSARVSLRIGPRRRPQAQRSLRPAVSASAAQFVPAAEINASGPCGNPASNNG